MGKVLVIDPVDNDTDVLVVEVWEDIAGGAPVVPTALDGGDSTTAAFDTTYDGGTAVTSSYDTTLDGGGA